MDPITAESETPLLLKRNNWKVVYNWPNEKPTVLAENLTKFDAELLAARLSVIVKKEYSQGFQDGAKFAKGQ